MKADIKSMTIEELSQLLAAMGQQKYRALQIFRWMAKGAAGFDEMTNLPQKLRAELNETAYIEKLKPEKIQVSKKTAPESICSV